MLFMQSLATCMHLAHHPSNPTMMVYVAFFFFSLAVFCHEEDKQWSAKSYTISMETSSAANQVKLSV